MSRHRSSSAFALLELLAVLAILSILAAVAMPSFQDAVVASRRSEAQSALHELMQQQERYYTQNNRYVAFSVNATEPEARQFRWWSGSNAPASAYELEGKACTGEDISDCIQLIATPGSPQVDKKFKDHQCEKLTLTSSGERMASGPALRCWR